MDLVYCFSKITDQNRCTSPGRLDNPIGEKKKKKDRVIFTCTSGALSISYAARSIDS